MTAAKKRPKPIAPDAPEPLSEVDEILRQLDGNSMTAKLQRENMTTKRWDHVGRIEPVTLDFIDDVKATFGGGNYRVRLYNGTDYIKGGYRSFSISGKPKDEEDSTPSRPAPLAPVAQKSGVEWAKDIAAIVVPVATAVGLVMKELRSGNSGSDVAQTVKMLHDAEAMGEQRGRTIGRLEAGAPKEEKGTMLDVAREFAGPFFQVLANKGAQQQQQLPAPSAINTPPEHHNAPMPTSAPILPPEYNFLLPIRPHYPLLAAQAQSDTHPGVVADFVLAKMGEQDLLSVSAAVQRADFLETMRAELRPIHQRYPEWLDHFLSRIIESGTPDVEEEPAVTTTEKPARRKRNA